MTDGSSDAATDRRRPRNTVTRRKLLLAAPVVAAVGFGAFVAVAGCGPFRSDDDDSDAMETAQATPTADVTVPLTLLMPDASGNQTIAISEVLKDAAFAAAHKVKQAPLRPTGGQTYSEAVTQLAAAGTSPDLVWMDQFALPTLAAQGVTRALTEYTRRDFDFSTDRYWPHILSSGAYRGTLHALPLSAGVCTLLYNPALFKQTSTPLPEANWRLTDFLALARSLNDATGTPRVWGVLQSPLVPPFFALAWQEGSTLFQDREWNVTHPAVIAALQFQADLILTHEVAPPLSLVNYRADNLTLSLTNTAEDMLLSGQIGMAGALVRAEPFWRRPGRAPLELATLPRGNEAATWGLVEHMVGIADAGSRPDAAYEALYPLAQAAAQTLSLPALRTSAEALRTIHRTLTVNDSLMLVESMEQSRYIDADAPEWLAFLVMASLIFPVLTGQTTAHQAAIDTQNAIQMQLNAAQATPTAQAS